MTLICLSPSFFPICLPPIENSDSDKEYGKGQGDESAAGKKQTKTTQVKRETDPGMSEGKKQHHCKCDIAVIQQFKK